jgi:HEAT repeat protein
VLLILQQQKREHAMGRKNGIYAAIAVALALGLTGCGETTLEDIAVWQEGGKVSKLIKATGSHDQELRAASIKALGELKAEEAVAPLAALYHDDDLYITLTAVDALIEIGSDAAQLQLIKALDLKTMRGRLAAATALGNFKTEAAVDPLIRLLDDSFDEVAAAAAKSLGQIHNPKAIDPLIQKVNVLSHEVKFASMTSLRGFGGEKIADSFVPALSDIGKKIRRMAIDTYIELGKPAAPYGHAAIRSDDKITRMSGISILKGIDAVPTSGSNQAWYILAEASTKKKESIDPAVVDQLAEMGKEAIPSLLEAVAYSTLTIRETAFLALEKIGEPCADPALKAAQKNAGTEGRFWLKDMPEWPGAPSWRLDLWASATALNPEFKIIRQHASRLRNLDSAARRHMKNIKFIPTREYVPLLIQQLGPNSGDEHVINFFGIKSQFKNLDLRPVMPDNLELSIKLLVKAGDDALFPLIAALEDDESQIADACAEILGRINNPLAAPPLMKLLEEKLEAQEDLRISPFYTALVKMEVPEAQPLLERIRPCKEYAQKLFEKNYPDVTVMRVRSTDATAAYAKPVQHHIGYLKNEKMTELTITFAYNEGQWSPAEPLPDQIP